MERRALPFARRFFNTFLPAFVFIRFRKPCFRFALILLGWKVLFIFHLRLFPNEKICLRIFVIEKPSLHRLVNAKTFRFLLCEFFLPKLSCKFFSACYKSDPVAHSKFVSETIESSHGLRSLNFNFVF